MKKKSRLFSLLPTLKCNLLPKGGWLSHPRILSLVVAVTGLCALSIAIASVLRREVTGSNLIPMASREQRNIQQKKKIVSINSALNRLDKEITHAQNERFLQFDREWDQLQRKTIKDSDRSLKRAVEKLVKYDSLSLILYDLIKDTLDGGKRVERDIVGCLGAYLDTFESTNARARELLKNLNLDIQVLNERYARESTQILQQVDVYMVGDAGDLRKEVRGDKPQRNSMPQLPEIEIDKAVLLKAAVVAVIKKVKPEDLVIICLYEHRILPRKEPTILTLYRKELYREIDRVGNTYLEELNTEKDEFKQGVRSSQTHKIVLVDLSSKQ